MDWVSQARKHKFTINNQKNIYQSSVFNADFWNALAYKIITFTHLESILNKYLKKRSATIKRKNISSIVGAEFVIFLVLLLIADVTWLAVWQ